MNQSLKIKILICIVIIINTSCIHTNKHEVKKVELENGNHAFSKTLNYKNLQIKNIVYTESKFPLSEFFNKLMDGEFSESIKSVNFNLKLTNTTNQIMHDLLSNGIVPVHVSIKNVSDNEMTVYYKQFYLTNGNDTNETFSPKYLPNEFKKFSPPAVAANVFNFTVVLTITFMIALLLSPLGHLPPGSANSSKKSDSIYNDTEKTVRIDYKHYVIDEKSLKPGEEVYGLLFFSLKRIKSAHGFYLEYKEEAQ
ncbi:MAG: hypothetical protein AABY53_00395 [Bdellovibrionota bacterium]